MASQQRNEKLSSLLPKNLQRYKLCRTTSEASIWNTVCSVRASSVCRLPMSELDGGGGGEGGFSISPASRRFKVAHKLERFWAVQCLIILGTLRTSAPKNQTAPDLFFSHRLPTSIPFCFFLFLSPFFPLPTGGSPFKIQTTLWAWWTWVSLLNLGDVKLLTWGIGWQHLAGTMVKPQNSFKLLLNIINVLCAD